MQTEFIQNPFIDLPRWCEYSQHAQDHSAGVIVIKAGQSIWWVQARSHWDQGEPVVRGQIVVQWVSGSRAFFQSHVSGSLISLLFGVAEPASKSSKRTSRQQGPLPADKKQGQSLCCSKTRIHNCKYTLKEGRLKKNPNMCQVAKNSKYSGGLQKPFIQTE